MANIGTIQVRCFRKPNHTRRVRSRTLRKWMCPSESYCVPIWSRDWLSAGVVDFQYGSRHGTILSLKEKCSSFQSCFSSIWVRRYNDSNDEESYHVFKDGREKTWLGEYYAYDEIELKLKSDLSKRLDSKFIVTGTNKWKRAVGGGRYSATNARVIWEDQSTISTCSTDTSHTFLSTWPQNFPTSLRSILESQPQQVISVNLFWKKRRVKRIIVDTRFTIRQYCCDHWDNFILDEYQEIWQKHQSIWQLK